MKKLITFIIALLLMITWASCTSKSGNKPTPLRPSSYTVDIIRIQYDTTFYKMLNDTVAYDKMNKSYMVRIKSKDNQRDRFIHVH